MVEARLAVAGMEDALLILQMTTPDGAAAAAVALEQLIREMPRQTTLLLRGMVGLQGVEMEDMVLTLNFSAHALAFKAKEMLEPPGLVAQQGLVAGEAVEAAHTQTADIIIKVAAVAVADVETQAIQETLAILDQAQAQPHSIA